VAEAVAVLSNRVLTIANRHVAKGAMLRDLAAALQEFAGCSAIGIRILNQQRGIPYEAYVGFPEAFYRLESPLSLDTDYCMCICVVKGQSDPALPPATPGGSFRLGSISRHFGALAEEQRGRFRNVCRRFGYESVALVPIRDADRIVGLIHLADPRQDAISSELVQVLEGVAAHVAGSLRRLWTEEDLQRAERLASVGTLAAGIAHEIAGPLGAILLAVDVAQRRLECPQGKETLRECLDTIQAAASRCERIVRSVQEYARAGTLPRELCGVRGVADRAMEAARDRAARHSITLRLSGAERLPMVLMNPIEMEQAIVNLLVNAAEASEPGREVHLRVWAEADQVRIACGDRGCGMTPEQMERIFDPFYTTKLRTGGTGLGLSIVQSIVRQHGGTIDVRSTPGRGSTMTIALPACSGA